MKKAAFACVWLLWACGSKGDDCQRVYDRMEPMMKQMAGGKDLGDAKGKFLEECRKEHDKFLADPVMKCMLDAKDDKDAANCLKKGMEEYSSKSKATEAGMQLNSLAKKLKVAAAESGSFPTGKAKTLPAGNAGGETCCGANNNKCEASKEWATDPVWSKIGFSIDEPGLYRYTYESTDGKSFTATAVGDLDCDGKTATYTLTGKLDASGAPSTDLQRPPAGAY